MGEKRNVTVDFADLGVIEHFEMNHNNDCYHANHMVDDIHRLLKRDKDTVLWKVPLMQISTIHEKHTM